MAEAQSVRNVKFLAAVSGGADSMALLAALCALTRGFGREALFCMHIDHGLRQAEERKADAELVRDFCEKQGINCRIEVIPPGKIASYAKRKKTGIEAAARFFRRRALFAEAARLGENTYILIAHTKDDMLETALMRVLRGSGPSGLAAMPAVRGKILRPLINMSRADILNYLKEKNIPWREDSTNTDEKFLRNRIRRSLIPLLNESFPSWKTAVCGMAETQSLAADFIAGEAKSRVIWSVLPDGGGLATGAENFFAQPEIIREEALFLAVDLLLHGKKNPRPVKRSSVRRFCAGNMTANSLAEGDLGHLRVRRDGGGKIVLSVKKNSVCESGFSLLIKEPGLYNLKKISVEVYPPEALTQFDRQSGGNGFFAVLPLVFRQPLKDDFLFSGGRKISCRAAAAFLSAIDALGVAAFIGSKGILFARDLPPPEGERSKFYFLRIEQGKEEVD